MQKRSNCIPQPFFYGFWVGNWNCKNTWSRHDRVKMPTLRNTTPPSRSPTHHIWQYFKGDTKNWVLNEPIIDFIRLQREISDFSLFKFQVSKSTIHVYLTHWQFEKTVYFKQQLNLPASLLQAAPAEKTWLDKKYSFIIYIYLQYANSAAAGSDLKWHKKEGFLDCNN